MGCAIGMAPSVSVIGNQRVAAIAVGRTFNVRLFQADVVAQHDEVYS